MPNNDFEGNMSHFILIAPTKKILCFQKLHFKFLELQNCIWGARIQDPASFPALGHSLNDQPSLVASLYSVYRHMTPLLTLLT